MEIDISKLSFDDLTNLEKQIKAKKNQMHNNREAFYKTEANPKEVSELCKRRFPPELYSKSKIHHCEDGDYTELDFKMYCRLEQAILNICDAVTGNYIIKDDKIIFKGCVVSKYPKEYRGLANEIGDLIEKYDLMIFENGKEK